MAEETEAVRVDRSKRQLEQRERVNWGGKRFVIPQGTTLPTGGEDGEIFKLNRASPLRDQLYIFDGEYNNWSTVGP